MEVDGGIMEGVSARLCGARASCGGASVQPLLFLHPGALQGGQILRVSTALSCLLGLPLRVQKIRAGRSTPGLRYHGPGGMGGTREGWVGGMGVRRSEPWLWGGGGTGQHSECSLRPSFLSIGQASSCS